MSQIDTEKLCAESPIDIVVGGYIELKKNGNEFLACCPFHTEKTPSFTVAPDKGFYHCFGCGAHGDAIDFVMNYEGIKFTDACKMLGGESELGGGPCKKRQKPRSRAVNQIDYYAGIKVLPVPEQVEPLIAGSDTPLIFNPKRADDPARRTTTYIPSMVFPYENADGELLGYVIRVDFGDGKKITPVITWCELSDGTQMWAHMRWPTPMPLYGLKRLAENPGRHVMVCEGEKAADAAARLMGDSYAVISWPGGTGAVAKIDWSPLNGRAVLFWPDMDETGINAVNGTHKKPGAAQMAHEAGAIQVRYLQLDTTRERGWDAADAESAGMNKQAIVVWAKAMVTAWKPVIAEGEQANEPPPEQPDETSEEGRRDQINWQDNQHENQPFRFLGYGKGPLFHYLPDRSQQIVTLTAAQHTKNNLVALAPMNHWEENFPGKGGADFDSATNALINRSYATGVFDVHEHLRGRGAWLDAGRSILHLGTNCYVDGVEISPKDIEGKHIYEIMPDIGVKISAPATSKQANELVEICDALSWENNLSGALLAGWCVIAPVCGVLQWRPHIWITGPSGCGKTTVIKDIIGRVTGKIAINMEGKSTEAGIRQMLCQDARPIVFDEAEAEDANSARRMQAILDLARVASSGGRIIKGTQSGGGMSFSVRSCFCFSSINTSVAHFADESRINKLILNRDFGNGAKDRYDELDRRIKRVFTKDYSSAMLSRSLKYLPTLQANCEVFIDAATRIFRSRRVADQVGTMLAGLYLCYSNKEVDADAAEKWILKQDWSNHTVNDVKQDSERLIDYLVTIRVRVITDKGAYELSVGELILIADYKTVLNYFPAEAANKELRRIGMMVEDEKVYIVNRSDPLKQMLDGSPWVNDWGRPLRDIHGAQAHGNRYFAPGIRGRGTSLPVSMFVDEDKAE